MPADASGTTTGQGSSDETSGASRSTTGNPAPAPAPGPSAATETPAGGAGRAEPNGGAVPGWSPYGDGRNGTSTAGPPSSPTAGPTAGPPAAGSDPDVTAPHPASSPPSAPTSPSPSSPTAPSPSPRSPSPGQAPAGPAGDGLPPGPTGPAGLPPSAEPPPAPVLIPQAGGRRGRGRHASAKADRASRRGLRVNQRLWSIDPWSVFKLSVLFYLCVFLIVLVAGTLLYNAGRRVGTVDQVESFVTRMGAYGSCTAKDALPAGTEFEEDDDCGDGEVLVGGFKIDDGVLFKSAAIGGGILVVAGTLGNVLLTVLVNLLNEVTGGLRHTVIREPVPRSTRGSPPRPAARVSGSPRRRVQR
jgi:hypothetical protein